MGKTVTLIERGIALGMGGALWYCQWQLVQGYYNSDNSTLKVIVPLITAALALGPSAIHRAAKERAWLLACVGTGICAFLFFVSCATTLARVTEFRAAKGSGATAATRTLNEAKDALRRAEAAERDASIKVDQFCTVTTTQTTTAKKVRTETKEANPLCDKWTGELTRRQANTVSARNAPGLSVVVPEADTDVKQFAEMFGLPVAVVEHWYPAGLPLGLEFILMGTFLFACRPLSYAVQEQHSPVIAPIAGATILETDDGMPQEYINACVAKWIDERGLPEGRTISQARSEFNAWLRTQELVSVVRFGKALTVLGVKKRKLGGRVLIAEQPGAKRKTR